MERRKIIVTTLGDFIVAVTDEVAEFIEDPLGVNLIVACILSDALPHRDTPVCKLLRQIIALAEKSHCDRDAP